MNDVKILVGATKSTLGIQSAPHYHSGMTTSRIMLITCACLLPALVVMFIFQGAGVIYQFVLSALSAALAEIVVALLRKKAIFYYIKDCSFLVSALILALTLPPLLVWYLNIAATLFAILLVKHCFGGLGMNIFNPAMAGFIFLLISVPSAISQSYITPVAGAYARADFNACYEVIFEGRRHVRLTRQLKAMAQVTPDTFSGATILESIKTLSKGQTSANKHDLNQPTFAFQLYLSLALALGGLVLMLLRIIFKRMVLTFFCAYLMISALGYYFNDQLFLPPVEQLLFGGTILAGFFIITDPVTNAGTSKGRIVFAILVAFLIIMLRTYGSHADSVAFAIMLANCAAPLIDVLTRRRKYGINYKRGQSNL